MPRWLSALFLPLLALSCRSAPATPARVAPDALERFDYRASVATVPAGASIVTLRVGLAEAGEGLRALSAHCLVGNALLELPLGDEPVTRANAQATLTWTASGELQVTTRGRPVELGLALARPTPGGEAAALERTLTAATRATADGLALAPIATRLERVR